MIKFFILGLFVFNICYADCQFILTNNSKDTVSVEAGYFKKAKVAFTITPATTNMIYLKNDLRCTDINRAGLGITYINLIGGKSSGGWIYDPSSKMIRAVGETSKSASGRIGMASNGTKLFLMNTTKPSVDTFEVQLNNADRNISRQFGSMD